MGALGSERGPGCRGRNRARWRAHVSAQASEGVSAAAYCRTHGLDPRCFYRWRRLLFASGEVSAGGAVDADGAPLFAEVRVGAVSSEASGVEVCLGGGRIVRVARDFDAATLRRVVSALEEGGC